MGFERLLHIPPKKTEVKSIKCFEVHTVKQTEKTVFVYRSPFSQGNGEFFVQRRNSRVQCNLNAILIFRQKSLTPSLNRRRYTVLYENSAGV